MFKYRYVFNKSHYTIGERKNVERKNNVKNDE